MSRYGLHRVQALWPIAAAGLLLVVLPAVAWADDCSGYGDCFHSAVAAATAAGTAIGTFVWFLFDGPRRNALPGVHSEPAIAPDGTWYYEYTQPEWHSDATLPTPDLP